MFLRHVGIVVSNLDAYKSFLRELDLIVVSDEVESGRFISDLVNMSKVEIRVAKLKMPCGSMIELLEYLSHPDEKESPNRMPNTRGISHIALSVRDIKATLEIFLRHQGQTIGPICLNNENTVWVVYCRDMYGNIYELVEKVTEIDKYSAGNN